MWMSPAQLALKDPEAYKRPIRREAVIADIDSGRLGRDHETTAWMRRAAEEVNEGGDLTIAAAEDSAYRAKAARDRPHDRAYHNFAILSAIGSDALLKYLIARANKIADSVQPGAADELADAF